MKKWRTVFGTEAVMPEEFDTTSSPETVYQRRNIKEVTRDEPDGEKVKGWEREERESTIGEYEQMMLTREVVNENKADIVASVTDFQKAEVIDEYTMQLVEEGLL